MVNLACTLCDSKIANTCSECEDAAFCFKGCKAEGNRIHKILCAARAPWISSHERPGEDSFLAVYFPVDGTVPELFWTSKGLGRLKAGFRETDAGPQEKIDLLSVEGDEPISGDIEITHNLATGNKLPHPLNLSVRDPRGWDGSTVNLSILEMTQGDQRGLWAGPAVLWSWRDHISLADLTYFATFLKSYRDTAGSLKHAIRVNDLEHVRTSRPELFGAVKEAAKTRKEARDAAGEESEVEDEGQVTVRGKKTHIILRITR